ncbi:MAG: MFS transporter, partial [Candidatus Goldbacteria bacterium]|nr:MFS transporter [Candidatus Goldiibacteriota bacterium]
GFEPAVSGFIAGAFWGAYTLGRISAGFYSKFMKTYKLIYLSLTVSFIGVLLIWLNINEALDYAGVVLNGFAIGPVFPALVSGTEKRVGGQHAFNVVGMQMAASGLGYAVLPWFAGLIAKYQGLEIMPAFVAVLIVITAALYRLAYYYMPGHMMDRIVK